MHTCNSNRTPKQTLIKLRVSPVESKVCRKYNYKVSSIQNQNFFSAHHFHGPWHDLGFPPIGDHANVFGHKK